jgi:anaerobic ribonucleoside-triphosphate reductase
MQKISDKMGDNQFARIGVVCEDCGREFTMILERTGPDKIEIKNGAIGKRGGEYLFKCPACWNEDKSFGLNCDVYSRVVGYLRPVGSWNTGKQSEYSSRKVFEMPERDI